MQGEKIYLAKSVKSKVHNCLPCLLKSHQHRLLQETIMKSDQFSSRFEGELNWSRRTFVLFYWSWSWLQSHTTSFHHVCVTKWPQNKKIHDFVREISATGWHSLFLASHSQANNPWRRSFVTQFHFLWWVTFREKLSVSFHRWNWTNIFEENSLFRS